MLFQLTWGGKSTEIYWVTSLTNVFHNFWINLESLPRFHGRTKCSCSRSFPNNFTEICTLAWNPKSLVLKDSEPISRNSEMMHFHQCHVLVNTHWDFITCWGWWKSMVTMLCLLGKMIWRMEQWRCFKFLRSDLDNGNTFKDRHTWQLMPFICQWVVFVVLVRSLRGEI